MKTISNTDLYYTDCGKIKVGEFSGRLKIEIDPSSKYSLYYYDTATSEFTLVDKDCILSPNSMTIFGMKIPYLPTNRLLIYLSVRRGYVFNERNLTLHDGRTERDKNNKFYKSIFTVTYYATVNDPIKYLKSPLEEVSIFDSHKSEILSFLYERRNGNFQKELQNYLDIQNWLINSGLSIKVAGVTRVRNYSRLEPCQIEYNKRVSQSQQENIAFNNRQRKMLAEEATKSRAADIQLDVRRKSAELDIQLKEKERSSYVETARKMEENNISSIPGIKLRYKKRGNKNKGERI